MIEIPSRKGLVALAEAARNFGFPVTLGFVRPAGDGRFAVLYSYRLGFGQFVLDAAELPEVFVSTSSDVCRADVASMDPQGVMEGHLMFADARQFISVAIPGCAPATRLWLGLSDSTAPADADASQWRPLAEAAGRLLQAEISPEETSERLRRFELAADLLPALLDNLDVREVFDRLSTTAKAALSHDLLILNLFNRDLTTVTVYARSDRGSDIGSVHPHTYTAAITRAWQFDIADDLANHPRESHLPPAQSGMKSALRLPIRFAGSVIGGIGFLSFERALYTSEDVLVARRLAELVAVGLSHHQLAEESRRAAALQERQANLDLLDGLMNAITDVLDVREVFDRIFEVSQRALTHDAMSLVVPTPDGERLTVFARTGALRHLPVEVQLPLSDRTLMEHGWDHVLMEDCSADPRYASSPSVQAGMRSLVMIPVRLEEQLRGWVSFWSALPGRFTVEDVPVARRIAAHITLTLSHQRIADQTRLTEDLKARAANLELLDDLLAPLIGSADLKDVFGRVCTITGKVLPHDAAALLASLPDGRHAKAYAAWGFPPGLPETTEIPRDVLDNPDWEHHIFDDLSSIAVEPYTALPKLGFFSLLRVPIRLDGRFAGALILFSKTRSAFKQSDVIVARRLADQLAVTVAHDREAEASRRADEATERAARLESRVRTLTEELDARTGFRRVIGESNEWREVLKQATQVAATEATVLLLGESGTGKEVIARFVHRASMRHGGPFVALNCAALPEHLLEAELFGYERGAFTGAMQSKPGQIEQAAGGTLFLDEVGEMSPSAQAKFLRVLQEREFQRLGGTRILRAEVRVVAATNRDLQRAIVQGQFREDLYYRLNVFAIRLPALRNRRDDVLPLSEAFLNEIGRSLGRPPAGISRDARQRLLEYHWPGNVRELRNILERAAILCDGGLITADHLALTVTTPPAAAPPPKVAMAGAVSSTPPVAASEALPAPMTPAAPVAPAAPAGPPASAADLESMERTMIEQALKNARFNKSKAARELGLTRHQLYVRMKKYGFE